MNRDYKKSEICNRGRKVETVDDFGQSRKNNNSKNLRCSSREIGNTYFILFRSGAVIDMYGTRNAGELKKRKPAILTLL